MATLRSYGGALEFIGGLSAGVAALITSFGDSNAAYVTEYLQPVSVSGGAQEGYLELRRLIAGTERVTHELRYHAVRQHSKSIANSATAVMTVTLPAGAGVAVECTAWGFESGVSFFVAQSDITAANNSGTLSTPVVANATKSPAGSGAVFTAAASGGSNLEIRFAHGSATPATIKFVFVVKGEFTNFTLN
jgi:hypothetical protein